MSPRTGMRSQGVQDRFRRYASTFGNQVVGALLTAVALHLAYMFFNDHIAPPPDLFGQWRFTEVYDNTALSDFKDLKVTYEVLLLQEGEEISGTGEKVSDQGPNQDPMEYVGENRTNIEVTGAIVNNYLSGDMSLLHHSESGRRRESSTIHRLAICGADIMCGCYRSTIADTSGRVWWQRGERHANLYESIEEPEACTQVDCSTSRIGCS